MLILIVGRAQTQAFVLHLTPPATAKRHKGRITTYPLLTTRCLDSRRLGIAAKATMLTSHRLGFHAVVCHGIALSGDGDGSAVPLRPVRGASRHRSLRSAAPRVLSTHDLSSGPLPWGEMKARAMSQLAKVKHRRPQWKRKAKERGDADRDLRKQLTRVKSARDQATQALKEAQARLRQLASHTQAVAVVAKVDVVWLSRRLFGEARMGLRAVCRVLTLLAQALGLTKAPCPHTLINWVMRLSIVRIQAARCPRGLPLRQAPFSHGLIGIIDSSIGLGTGKI